SNAHIPEEPERVGGPSSSKRKLVGNQRNAAGQGTGGSSKERVVFLCGVCRDANNWLWGYVD
ncbi:MAG TPA: hypothetical protein VEQ18_00370, partial [Candidatus Nitrosocosmicus sp.]|nr:hypothetical protein [Candidatus Nitrosocosmicus sp.]